MNLKSCRSDEIQKKMYWMLSFQLFATRLAARFQTLILKYVLPCTFLRLSFLWYMPYRLKFVNQTLWVLWCMINVTYGRFKTDLCLLKQKFYVIIGYWDMQSLEVQQELKSDQSAQNWPAEWIEQWLTLRTGARILLLKSCKKISARRLTWPWQLLLTTVGIWKSNLENKRARRFYNLVNVSTHFQVKLCQAGQYVWGKVAWV